MSSLAAGLLLVLALGLRPPGEYPPSDPAAEPSDNTVAVLLRASGAEWGETDLPTRAGVPLPPGRLRLRSGLAHIQFYSGATVILEGPADFQLLSRTEAYCWRGKLRATVPTQAQGFTIRSPNLDLIDRGTEFGLQVDPGEQTEVHVFQGKVEWYDGEPNQRTWAPKELTTGQGVRLEGPGQVRRIPSTPAAFQTAQDLAARSEAETRRRHQDWLVASAARRQDPELLVYYPFQAEQPGSLILRNQARAQQQPHNGVIVGCAWGTGRWPGKQGLEFKQVSDRVRLHVPGEFDALTLLTWVRVDVLPNRYSSLLMTDGWEKGAPHWHIRQDGKISLGVMGFDRTQTAHYFTSVVFTPERLGQWTQLAVVYDRDGQQVTHYVDGRPVKQKAIELDIPLHLGDAEIGNWNTASFFDKHPIRHLSGCMDEFLLLARALTELEIEQLYLQGRPP